MDNYRALATEVIRQYVNELNGDPNRSRASKVEEFEEWFNTTVWGQLFDLEASAVSRAIL